MSAPGQVGRIDLVLVSESGRLCIVETKLAKNPQARREVVAHLLEYATSLSECTLDELRLTIPHGEDGTPLISKDAIEDHLAAGDFLLIIAADRLDGRAVRLGQNLLGKYMANESDLAMVDISLFQREGSDDFLVVPNLRGALIADVRQVVRVEVEGSDPAARVRVERVPSVTNASARQKWSEEMFLEKLTSPSIPEAFARFARAVIEMGKSDPELELSWGTGQTGSVTLKRNNQGVLEVALWPSIQFRRDKILLALGETVGQSYIEKLEAIEPRTRKMTYPNIAGIRITEACESIIEILRDHLRRAGASK